MKFRSKVDVFNILMFLIITIGLVLPLFLIGFSIWYLCLVVALVVFMSVVMFGSYYKLNEDEIIIRNGFCGFSLAYESIKEITLVKSFKVSSKTALKGVRLGYKYGKASPITQVYISPSKEEAFLRLLQTKCTKVVVASERRKASEK